MRQPHLAMVPVMALLLGCGQVSTPRPHNAAPPDANAADVRDAGHEAPDDATTDGEAEAPLEGGIDVDAAPRCPPVAPADLQATFVEKRIAAGSGHTCGIRDDGTVACWGGIGHSKATPPSGTFVRLSAGYGHTCGIRTSGEVECWGDGKETGLCDLRAYEKCGQSLAPPGPFIEIAAGDAFTCGLRPDFTIECWGANVEGEAEPPCGQFVQMSAGSFGACAVAADGTLECWGSAKGVITPRDEPVKQVALGGSCRCILYEAGEVDCWLSQLAYPGPGGVSFPWTRDGVAAVSCGQDHACAILDDGTVDCSWGPPDGTYTEISCGFLYCCGLRTDGSGHCWGARDNTGRLMPDGFPAAP